MSIYIHIDQRSHNNMLLIVCGTLDALIAPINVKHQRGWALLLLLLLLINSPNIWFFRLIYK